ncbi:MAG: response regulator [Phototrophicaceae bacterium]
MAHARILIVDDDPLNVEVMQLYLELDHFQVFAVSSGEKALEIVKTQTPDLILMDVRMSGLSGYETCRRLKDNPATATIPVLMVTAFSEEQDIQQAIDAGVDDLLFKPINGKIMILRIKSLVRIKRLSDQLQAKP